jgi:hypothetical protein
LDSLNLELENGVTCTNNNNNNNNNNKNFGTGGSRDGKKSFKIGVVLLMVVGERNAVGEERGRVGMGLREGKAVWSE